MSKTKVLYHSYGEGKHCPDGFAAAFAMWDWLGPTADYIPVVHGQPVPNIDYGDTVYLVDFSYSWEELSQLMLKAERILILDHHKTAKDTLEHIKHEKFYIKFDMDKSGAQLAWAYNHLEPEPPLISYVADRDLWKHELPYTQEIHLALSSFPQDFEVWETLAFLPNYVDFMRHIGEPLLAKRNAEIMELLGTVKYLPFIGYSKSSVLNTDKYGLVSDALNILAKQSPHGFALNWSKKEGKMKIELRSVGDFDVSKIAKEFGGGGHLNAAGCEVLETDPRIADLIA